MTYAEFKAFVTTFLWRDGDTVLTNNLDNLIKMANAELNRVFKVEDRTITATTPVTDNTATVPSDYREMRSLSLTDVGPMTYLTPLEFSRQDVINAGRQRLPIFTVSNDLILLSGDFSPENPGEMTMVYYANIPDFAVTDTSWVADDYLDVYAYCVLKQSAPFLREDDRLQVWTSAYGAALQSALDENAARKYTGSPQKITYGGVY
jgi:hypothetical protein